MVRAVPAGWPNQAIPGSQGRRLGAGKKATPIPLAGPVVTPNAD
jgi:hypothetical protein